MKPQLFLFCALFIVLVNIAVLAQTPNDLNIEGLIGKVKRIDEDTAEMKMKNGILKEGGRNRSRTVIFDKQGRKTYEWIKIGDLSPSEHYYSCKQEKCFIRAISSGFSVGSDKPLESFSLYVFNYKPEENSLYREVFIGKPPTFDVKTQKYKYSFDDQKRVVEELMYSPNDKPVLLRKYIYTSERLPVEVQVGAASGNSRIQVIKYTYTLDPQGNWIKQDIDNTLADINATKIMKVIYRTISYYK